MLLRKKFNFFLYLFSVKIRLEIILHKVWDRKETFFDYKNEVFETLKNGIFPKGLIHAFGQQMDFFRYLFTVKKGLEMRLNDVLDRNKLFLTIKKKFSMFQKWHFPDGVNSFFWSKHGIFFLYFFSVKKGLEIRLNDVLDRKQTFFD